MNKNSFTITTKKQLLIAIALVLLSIMLFEKVPVHGAQVIDNLSNNVAGYSLFHPLFVHDNTSIHIQNINNEETIVMLDFSSQGGHFVYSAIYTLAGNTSLKIAPKDIPVAIGVYSLTISSSGPIESALVVIDPRNSPDAIGMYSGERQGVMSATFAPFTKELDGSNSDLVIMNIEPTPIQLTLTYFNLLGAMVKQESRSLPPYGMTIFASSNIADLPTGFIGSVHLSSSGQFVGVVRQYSTATYRINGPLSTNTKPGLALQYHLPRIFYAVNEDGGLATSNILISNMGIGRANVFVSFYSNGGNVIAFRSDEIPMRGLKMMSPVDTPSLLPGELYSIEIASDQPLAIGEETDFLLPGPFSYGSYGHEPDNVRNLPNINKSEASYSVVFITNPQPVSGQISFAINNTDGSNVHSSVHNIPAKGILRLDLKDLNLSDDLEGGAQIVSNLPVAVWVDNYTWTTPPPLLRITKSGPAIAFRDQAIEYAITVENNGDGPAVDLVVSDAIPEGSTYHSGGSYASGLVIWHMPSLAAHDSATFTFKIMAGQAVSSLTNSSYQAKAAGGFSAMGEGSIVTQIKDRVPILSISKSGPTTAFIGAPIKYMISVMNSGDADAIDLVIRDTLPDGARFVSADEGGRLAAGEVVWQIGRLSPGSTAIFHFTVTADASIENSMYRVTASGDYEAIGIDIVSTEVSLHPIYLPFLIR